MNNWIEKFWNGSPKWFLILLTAILTTAFFKIEKGQLFLPIMLIIVLILALSVFIVLYFHTKKSLEVIIKKDKKEFISMLGVKWLINYTKKTIDTRPYCTCCKEPKQMKYYPRTYGYEAHFSCEVGNSIRELMNEDCKKYDLKEALDFIAEELNFEKYKKEKKLEKYLSN
ncbi:MAG TPA: hypothetical protein DCP53_02870 [Elusimicrobia bacterium]|nr:hypothetical protein [Elusimicrobiota bacterium]